MQATEYQQALTVRKETYQKKPISSVLSAISAFLAVVKLRRKMQVVANKVLEVLDTLQIIKKKSTKITKRPRSNFQEVSKEKKINCTVVSSFIPY